MAAVLLCLPSVAAAHGPHNHVRPSIDGTLQVGQTLTGNKGQWHGVPTGTVFHYTWVFAKKTGPDWWDRDVHHRHGRTTTLVAADEGFKVTLLVEADPPHGYRNDDDDDGWAWSETRGPVVAAPDPPHATTSPSLSGATRAGTGDLELDPGDIQLSQQWQRCAADTLDCTDIADDTGLTHTLSTDDVGSRLRGVVTAAGDDGTTTATTEPSAVIGPPPAPPVVVSEPVITPPAPPLGGEASISGGAVSGQALTLDPGTWNPAGVALSQQWQRCDATGQDCADVRGETGLEYQLTGDDVGYRVRAVVTGTNEDGTRTAATEPTGVVQDPPPPPTFEEVPPPPPPAGLRPVVQRIQLITPIAGTVSIRPPGSKRFIPVPRTRPIPNGSTVDAENGVADLIVETRTSGDLATVRTAGAEFRLAQGPGVRPYTDLTLTAALEACPKPRVIGRKLQSRRATVSAKRKRRKSRRLFSQANGRFRTKGRYATAIVRGTRWSTEDTCDGTRVQVTEGLVAVQDHVAKTTVDVPAGRSYLARPPRRR